MGDTGGGELRRALARYKPSTVRVQTVKGESVPVAVPSTRKRWEAVEHTVSEYRYQRVELLDQGGLVVGVVQGETPIPQELVTDEGNLALMLRAQDVALKRHSESIRVLVDGYAELVKTMRDQVEHAAAQNTHLLEVVEAYKTTAANAADGDTAQAEATQMLMSFLASKMGPL